mmetsp:Transcript_4692/g.7285  ORF Transcript_4692/g.7285 Transcript_4692/m.7285 type:complete len:471 (-) Transcript_4692:254-1666(-)|eukprot:CAMPEP_0184645306 /NCGR_PEP_ID=MMETSP0308-20130426/1791_1 /TAXON_ID=38269 /ORGANISM="Gloeochaete witrockiana, Strain SAG 46.84" /LENGTH=470 /DNA_ID=CAMNT_0027074205 /DNA_START=138 /DNA_END=1550 /DNA_ORIENTATION=-
MPKGSARRVWKRCTFCTVSAFVILSWLTRSSDVDEPPSPAELTRLATDSQSLVTSIGTFYLASRDKVNGGFFEEVGANGDWYSRKHKFVILQARHVWLFSTLAKKNIRRAECLAAAESGFQFLQQSFLDRAHGGYFSEVQDDGTVVDSRKHMYFAAFVIYGLVAYYETTGDKQALQAALDLFEIVDKHAYDAMYGGYREFFYADWKPITDVSEPPWVGEINTKTYNTHMHLMEAFTALCRVAPDLKNIRSRLMELIMINLNTVSHPVVAGNIDAWSNDWHALPNQRISYGHDMECVWLLFDAARVLGLSIGPIRKWALSVADYSIKYGFDNEHGGFFAAGEAGLQASDRRKVWWVQSEALVCMLELYTMTNDVKYYDAFKRSLEFVKKYQLAPEGGWWAMVNADGSHGKEMSRASMWQCGYHNGRAMMRIHGLLMSMADESNHDLAGPLAPIFERANPFSLEPNGSDIGF